MGAPVINRKYTYQDYLSWDDGKRWELFYGVPYELSFGVDPQNRSPAPNRRHQQVSGNLFRKISNYLLGKTCEVYDAPFDVRLGEEGGEATVVQPDLSVFCDLTKLDEQGGHGAPDWVVEILSPATLKRDLSLKLTLYQQYGVKEYWIADPQKNTVMVYILQEDGRFRYKHEVAQGEIIPELFPELVMPLADIFPE